MTAGVMSCSFSRMLRPTLPVAAASMAMSAVFPTAREAQILQAPPSGVVSKTRANVPMMGKSPAAGARSCTRTCGAEQARRRARAEAPRATMRGSGQEGRGHGRSVRRADCDARAPSVASPPGPRRCRSRRSGARTAPRPGAWLTCAPTEPPGSPWSSGRRRAGRAARRTPGPTSPARTRTPGSCPRPTHRTWPCSGTCPRRTPRPAPASTRSARGRSSRWGRPTSGTCGRCTPAGTRSSPTTRRSTRRWSRPWAGGRSRRAGRNQTTPGRPGRHLRVWSTAGEI